MDGVFGVTESSWFQAPMQYLNSVREFISGWNEVSGWAQDNRSIRNTGLIADLCCSNDIDPASLSCEKLEGAGATDGDIVKRMRQNQNGTMRIHAGQNHFRIFRG
ncbi:MAG: hypothetical protein N838_30805 [Thiohalocapsa sp. PB-PSB1]|nr:MAG: hypothetical protein N838_30805 [Thiohalocapsa sp. PB-PSB1]